AELTKSNRVHQTFSLSEMAGSYDRPGQQQNTVVQRYIVDDEGKEMSYSDIWEEIGEAVDGTPAEAVLNSFITSDQPVPLSYILEQLGGGITQPQPPITTGFGGFALPKALTPVEKIQAANLAKLTPIILQNSRTKHVYLFDSQGKPTTSKADAVYMVDT